MTEESIAVQADTIADRNRWLRVRVVALYALFAALWIFGSDSVLDVFVDDRQAVVRLGTYKGWLFVAVTSILLYGLMRGLTGPPRRAARVGPRTSLRRWLVPFGIGAAVVLVMTSAAITVSFDDHRDRESKQLEAVADLRAGQVSSWLHERTAQLRFGADGPIGELAARWLDVGGAATHEGLLSQLASFHKVSSGNGVMVLDRQGRIIASVGKHVEFTAELADVAARSFLGGTLTFTSPYPDIEGRDVYLDIAAPLLHSGTPARVVLVLRTHADDFLVPTLGHWPLPSRSAASMLLAGDGTPLIWPPVPPVPLRGALARSANAVMTSDSAGHSVLAVARHVAATGWLVVAKVDRDEADAGANRDAAWIAGFGAMVVFAWAIGLYLMREREALQLKQSEADQQAEKLRALQLLQSVADSSADTIYAKDREGRYLIFNREGCRRSGKTAAEVLGRDSRSLFPPAQAEVMVQSDRRVMATGKTFSYETQTNTVDGTLTYLTTKGPLQGADGEVIGVYGISRDITARLRSETALRESAELIRAVGNSVLDHLAVLDAGGKIIKANDAWRDCGAGSHAATCGAMQRCEPGVNYLEAVSSAELNGDSAARSGIEAVLAGRQAFFTLEYCCGCETPAQRWFVMKVTPLKTAAGGAVVVHSEITELKHATAQLARYRDQLEDLVDERTAQLEEINRALVESERFVRTMTDNMPAALAYWDRDLRCCFSNKRFRARYGLQSHAMLGMNLEQVVGRERYRELEPRVRNVLEGTGCSYPISSLRSHRGGERQYLVSLIPDTVDERVQGFFMLGSEVTELREAQQQLQRANDELVVARDRAEAANRAKSAFLANMSHEIRTPMNAIIGFADLLKTDCTEPAAMQRLENVSEAAHHLLALINDILDLSKIESGKFALEHINFSLQDAVGRSVMLVADQAAAKGVALVVDIARVPDALCGDPTRLSQALLNLLGNAVKFTERGRIDLAATVLEDTDAGVRLRFEVRDTGIGIPADKLHNLFGAFEQADSSTTRRFGGTGLGLALTRHIAELMGGETGVQSEPGRGSMFWLTVLLGHATASKGEADEPTVTPDALRAFRRGTQALEPVPSGAPLQAHVLVVEDNRFNQEVALAVLKRAGLKVDLAPDGLRAVEMAQACRYDLVLMDLQMPGMDGFEATIALRALAGYETTPILALTANAFGETRAACLAAGMNDHIAKPITPQRLCDVLARWLPRIEAPRPSVRPRADDDLADRLAGIEGFDPDSGLALIGDEEAYLGALRRFVGEHEDGVPGLDNCLATGQVEEARRMVHSLKGSAATIGARMLQELAAACEATIARREDRQHARLLAFDLEYELVHFVGALHDRLPVSPASGEAAPAADMTEEQFKAALETLGFLLASGDFGAQRLHREIAGNLRRAFGPPAEELAQAVRDHDHERAFELLEALKPSPRASAVTGKRP